MEITQRVVGDVTILDLKGKMTLGEGDEEFAAAVRDILSKDGKKILLNMEAVPYIDGAGLQVIVYAYTNVSRHQGTLKIHNLTRRIIDLLAITKLDKVFDIFNNEEEAVASFSEQTAARQT